MIHQGEHLHGSSYARAIDHLVEAHPVAEDHRAAEAHGVVGEAAEMEEDVVVVHHPVHPVAVHLAIAVAEAALAVIAVAVA